MKKKAYCQPHVENIMLENSGALLSASNNFSVKVDMTQYDEISQPNAGYNWAENAD